MQYFQLFAPGHALVALCTLFTLGLTVPQAVQAGNVYSMAQTRARVRLDTVEFYPFPGTLPSFRMPLALMHLHRPEMSPVLSPHAGEFVKVELQVPGTLLRTLQRQERAGRRIELQVPEAVQDFLATEGRVQMLQRRIGSWDGSL
jgi:hypothetical protein